MTRVLAFPVPPSRPSDAPHSRMALACAVLRAEVVRLMGEGIDCGVFGEAIK